MITLSETFNRIAEKIETEESVIDWSPMLLSDSKDPIIQKAYWDSLRVDPKKFMVDILGVSKTWAGQDTVLQLLAEHNKIGVASGHSLGKDYISARAILWFLYTHMPATVIATAPTDRQVEKVIWGELEEGYYKANKVLPGRLITKELTVDSKRRWYAMGFTTKDVHRSPGKFQGFHNRNVLVVFSEAQAIDRPIWDQSESLMTAEVSKMLAIGNPLVNFGPFYEACQPGSGFAVCHLDCEENPNYKERRIVIPGLATYQWVEDMAKKHGRNSTTFKSKVKGQFPATTTEAFINRQWVDWAMNRGMGSIAAGSVEVIGVDVAGPGSDKTVITKRRGMRVVMVKKYSQDIIETWTDEDGWTQDQNHLTYQSTMATADEIAVMLRGGVHRCYLDVGGLGLGIYDRLVQLHFKDRVVPVNFGGKPSSDDDETAEEKKNLTNRERYRNMVTQLYARFSKLLENRSMALVNDQALAMQLVSRKMFEGSDGKKILESKEDFMARGFDSPDEADSTVLCFADVEPREVVHESYVEVDESEGSGGDMWAR